MACFKDAGFIKPEILDLNRVRLHQQVLLLSNVLSADGRYIEEKNLTNRKPEGKWSRCVFPQERPSVADLRLWNTALAKIAPGQGVAQKMREFTASRHKIWEWPFCPETNRAFHWLQGVMDMYRQSHSTGMGRHPKYIMETEGVKIANSKESLLCSVEYTNAKKKQAIDGSPGTFERTARVLLRRTLRMGMYLAMGRHSTHW